jgi:hypothetical protein
MNVAMVTVRAMTHGFTAARTATFCCDLATDVAMHLLESGSSLEETIQSLLASDSTIGIGDAPFFQIEAIPAGNPSGENE